MRTFAACLRPPGNGGLAVANVGVVAHDPADVDTNAARVGAYDHAAVRQALQVRGDETIVVVVGDEDDAIALVTELGGDL